MGAQLSHEPLEQNVARDQYPGGSGSGPAGVPPVDAPPGSFTRRLSIRKSRKKRKAERLEASAGGAGGGPTPPGADHHHKHHKRMDRLRRSFRDSFRRKQKEHAPESARPHQWQADEKAVRDGTCSFLVKYQGCVQVYESRGMQVCEDALKLVRSQRRRAVRAVLYVSGDGLRVVDSETRDLLVDQTIEKVSFCAPDRNHERGFSYICRDGTTRRWMCHCFLAIRESGDRLSHAVGCAFAACLERKQKRDKECAVSMAVDPATASFTRYGSFRQGTITERLADPQELKPAEPVPVLPVNNPFAVERPRAPAAAVGLFERQGSLRVRSGRQQEVSPFKRQYSLRLNELPSNLERQTAGRQLPAVAPILESAGEMEETDNVTLLCRELAQGMDLLSDTPQIQSSIPCSPEPIAEEPSPSSEEPVRPDEWLQSLTNGSTSPEPAAPSPTAAPAGSDGGSTLSSGGGGGGWRSGDPFDSEWQQIAERNNQANVAKSTNPFAKNGQAKLFEVHM